MKKRKICLLVLSLVLILSGVYPVSASGFTDITDPEVYIAADTLKGLGIVDGVTSTKFCPDEELSRAEACTILINIMGLTSKLNTYAKKTLFNDVKAGAWYTPYVNLAYAQGIISGYGNGYFGPDDSITYGQLATMILHLLGYSASDIGNIWPYDYTDYCEEKGISSGLNLDPKENITRGDVAIMYYRALSAQTKNGKAYYTSTNTVSSVTNGIAYNKNGDAAGFIADSNDFTDIVIQKANASTITDTDGNTYRITGNARVVKGISSTLFTSGGYVQVNANAKETARLYYNTSGSISYIYIMAVSDEESNEKEYSYSVQGYISAASPSISAATSLTLGGASFKVDESALSALANYRVGSKVTLLLSDDNTVVDVKSSSFECEMIGVVSENGKSVTLLGSGVTLSAATFKCDSSAYGSLVDVYMSDINTIRCTKISTYSNYSGTLDLSQRTYKGIEISAYCDIFETVSNGMLYSLEGEQGKSSKDFSAIFWADKLENVYAKYVHKNDNGQIDILVLDDVTGNAYTYGSSSKSNMTDESGYEIISLVNSKGTKSYTISSAEEGMIGVGLKITSSNTMHVSDYTTLNSFVFSGESDELFSKDDEWYISHNGSDYKISENLEIYLKSTDKWSKGADNLTSILSDNYSFTFWYDMTPAEGGQIRIVSVN